MNRMPMFLTLCLLTAFCLTGGSCPDKATNPDPPYVPEMVAESFHVIAINDNTVKLSWTPPRDQNTNFVPNLAYRIRWQPADNNITKTTDTGTISAGDFHNTNVHYSSWISNLQPKLYNFRIQVVTSESGLVDATAADEGAPATRYTMDAARPGEPLRLYELGSSEGSGLNIDPVAGGPTRLDIQ